MAKEDAQQIASTVMQDKKGALDTLAREELGLDPAEPGGNPINAAGTSFALFAAGAIVPAVPFLLFVGQAAVIGSIGFSILTLGLVGAFTSLFNGRSAAFSAARQVVFGCLAARSLMVPGISWASHSREAKDFA